MTPEIIAYIKWLQDSLNANEIPKEHLDAFVALNKQI